VIAVGLFDTRQAYDCCKALLSTSCYSLTVVSSSRDLSPFPNDAGRNPTAPSVHSRSCRLTFPVGCKEYVQSRNELASQLALLPLSLARVPPSRHTHDTTKTQRISRTNKLEDNFWRQCNNLEFYHPNINPLSPTHVILTSYK